MQLQKDAPTTVHSPLPCQAGNGNFVLCTNKSANGDGREREGGRGGAKTGQVWKLTVLQSDCQAGSLAPPLCHTHTHTHKCCTKCKQGCVCNKNFFIICTKKKEPQPKALKSSHKKKVKLGRTNWKCSTVEPRKTGRESEKERERELGREI